MAIDGHFGLCRKKSAGKSVRPPLHVGVYSVEPQEKIDEFVSTYTVGKATAVKVLPLCNIHKIVQLYMTFLSCRSAMNFLQVIC